MKLIIVSGLSGSGKSIALNVLEDLEYYCIDNLPVSMLEALADEVARSDYDMVGVGIDARNILTDLDKFPTTLKQLRKRGIHCEVLFLEANDNTLIKRFSETRRKHPLSSEDTSLNEAILEERNLLEPISSCANLRIDTSQTTIHQLRDLIKDRVHEADKHRVSLMFESFGFKHGVPIDADFVFDIRCIPNPHWVPELRPLTGHDQAVIDYLESHHDVNEMFNDIKTFLQKWVSHFEADNRTYMTIAIGCTGGQHRSVYMVEKLAGSFKQQDNHVVTRHRELS